MGVRETPAADSAETFEGVVADLLKRRRAPQAVRNFQVRLGEDSDGNPAVWVEFSVDEDLKPSRAKLDELTALVDSTTRELISKHPQRWPYVRLRVPT